MILTNENYFSTEAMAEYMSCSQFKQFDECELSAMAQLRGDIEIKKDAFLEGHLFEALIAGGKQEELFMMTHPEMISSRGATKGQLKSNFAKIIEYAEAFKRQPLFTEIYNRCEKQKIFTGEIAGVKFKCCVDLYDPKAKYVYDTKCMKDFKKVYSEKEKRYLPWYFAYDYNFQSAIYQELVRQNEGACNGFGLLAVTKEPTSDVGAFEFSEKTVSDALEIVEAYAPVYNQVKIGEKFPDNCGYCNWCKKTKVLNEFEQIGEII